jgi:FdhE protein
MNEVIDRARELAGRYPSAAELLHFYGRLLTAFQSRAAAQGRKVPMATQPLCPFCGEKPVAAVLRPEGDGGKRFLLCSQCLTEWEFRRLLCPNCGEESHEKLPVYKVEEYPHIRIEACDTCKVYVKAIDMTLDGLAVPEVDEIASVAVDLWAKEKGYTKLQVNLLGL